jgi:hypothetical protein
MPSLTYKLRGTAITPRHAMQFIRTTPANGVTGGCRMICASPVFGSLLGLIIEAVETTEASVPYAIDADTASFSITITNDTGVALTALVLHTSHDGNGTIGSVTMPTTMSIGASATVTLDYTTDSEVYDPTITLYVTGTKPDTGTETSNTLNLLVDIDDAWIGGGE